MRTEANPLPDDKQEGDSGETLEADVKDGSVKPGEIKRKPR